MADAKLKRGEKTGNPYADFRLASDHPRRQTSFNRLRVLNKRLAEWAAEYVTKGRWYFIEGYHDGDRIIAQEIQFLDYPRDERKKPKTKGKKALRKKAEELRPKKK